MEPLQRPTLGHLPAQDSDEHLQMLDGLLTDLLEIKWATSIRGKFRSWLLQFTLLLFVTSLAYLTRFQFVSTRKPSAVSENLAHYYKLANNCCELTLVCLVLYNLAILAKRYILESYIISPPGVEQMKPPLRHKLKWVSMKILMQAPELMIFACACSAIILCVPLRLVFRWRAAEDFIVSLVIFLMPLKLLFFCRGSKSLGAFIVMIYRILFTDVLYFYVFLIVFICGFGQSFILIFKTYRPNRTNGNNDIGGGASNSTISPTQAGASNFFESLVREDESLFFNMYDAYIALLMMALNEFTWIADEFNSTDYPNLARIMLCLYMIIVSILLINMVIAMLGKTYQDISSQPNENLRQWARAMLTVERMCSRTFRSAMLDKYSHEIVVVSAQSGTQQPRVPDDSETVAQPSPRQRCFCTTKALDSRDLLEIDAVKRLHREHSINSLKLSHRLRWTAGQLMSSARPKKGPKIIQRNRTP